MWYKPNVSKGQSGSTYFTYGNPGYDKTGGLGDWTYINWSWVQNGGAKYPANKCAGGGMVRALGKRDAIFEACRVDEIISYAYGTDNRINGRVTAFYGKMFAGPGEKGSEIYGWMPHSYQKSGELIVPCVRRAEVKSHEATLPPPAGDQMVRMAWNLLHPAPPDAAMRQSLVNRYEAEPDTQGRMELLTEISRMDDLQTLAALLRVLSTEKEPRVREQAIALIGYLSAAAHGAAEISAGFAAGYRRADEGEQQRMLEVMSNIAAPETARWITSVWRGAASKSERVAAADALIKLAPRVNVDEVALREARQLRAKQKMPSTD
jgi:hypothetical protein